MVQSFMILSMISNSKDEDPSHLHILLTALITRHCAPDQEPSLEVIFGYMTTLILKQIVLSIGLILDVPVSLSLAVHLRYHLPKRTMHFRIAVQGKPILVVQHCSLRLDPLQHF